MTHTFVIREHDAKPHGHGQQPQRRREIELLLGTLVGDYPFGGLVVQNKQILLAEVL